jgi:hypothetical protein
VVCRLGVRDPWDAAFLWLLDVWKVAGVFLVDQIKVQISRLIFLI